MALYFPALSHTYRQVTAASEFRRRLVVCERLRPDYKAGRFQDKKSLTAIQADLAAEGITITPRGYQGDKAVLRAAHLWLTLAENEDERAAVLKKAPSPAIALVECLRQDGIRHWSDVIRLSNLPLTQAEPQAAREPLPSAGRIKLREFKAGEETAALIDELMPRLEAMLAENALIKSGAESLSIECTRLAGEIRDAEAYIQVVEQENTTLEERLRATKERLRQAHGHALEEIALEHPEVPQLLVLAQELKTAVRPKQDEPRRLLSRLPQEFVWASDRGRMVYEEQFLRALTELTPEEQGQVIRQLGVLAGQGAEYASLHTRKSEMRLPHSPSGCLVSRGGNDLRFTWLKKNGEAVVIHWLYRKGDSRVRHGEG